MRTIHPEELKLLIDSNEDIQIIDVREPYEYEEINISGLLIPLEEILERSEEISRSKKVIVHCKSGKRSLAAVEALEREKGFDNLITLIGGIEAYTMIL